MTELWEEKFQTEVAGRSVKGEVYDEGGYKVTTTQKSDHEGKVSGDKSGTVIVPPSASGTSIEIDGETLEELENELVENGEFTREEAKKITSMF